MSSDAAHTAMTTAIGAIATATTSESLTDAGEAFPRLPDHLVVTHILRSEYFDNPADLARLPAVSRAMRDAVAATGLQFAELDEHEAVDLGCSSALQRRHRQGRLSGQEYLCYASARSGQLEELTVLRANDCPWDINTCMSAARGAYLEVLRWLRANDCPWDINTCMGAARGAYLEVLRWLRANDCPWDINTCMGAASGGYLEVLHWARANGCPWDEGTCTRAAEYGHLDVLQWARATGCPWDETTCTWAAIGEHLDVLQWARANGCP